MLSQKSEIHAFMMNNENSLLGEYFFIQLIVFHYSLLLSRLPVLAHDSADDELMLNVLRCHLTY